MSANSSTGSDCRIEGQRNALDQEFDYDDWIYTLLDKLPTMAECVQSINQHAPTYGSTKQKDHIHQFSLRLIDLWKRAFGRDVNFLTIRGVKDKLDREMKKYSTKVSKAKGSRRSNMNSWKTETNNLFNLLAKGVDPQTFQRAERVFFEDQMSLARKYVIDTYVVDMEHEARMQQKEEQAQQKINQQQEDESEDVGVNDVSDLNFSFSISRSGTVRKTVSTGEASTQTDVNYNLREGARNFKDSIKTVLATSCADANISPQQSRVSFKNHAMFFGAEYCLTSSTARRSTADPPVSKKPRTQADYSCHYENVLPSPKTIARMKHLMAIQEERNAALALLDTLPSDAVTLHYDTTTRKRLKGEWPSIVLTTPSGKKFRLRSLNMAVEDRRNIVSLLITSLGRLAIASSSTKKALWEKISALMTDSVSKNLEIESLIAASLLSSHIPLHLLCVSHTCEVFDSGNLLVLKHVEDKLDLKNKIVLSMRSLQPFLSKGLIPAVITALCKLVSNDGHKSSIHEEFDDVLMRSGKPKKLALYKERRFGLLGYSAAALLHHLDDLKNTLEFSGANNQLVQACDMYMEIEYVEIALRCIAWFTYKITLPFLNMCELETPKTLLTLLPSLHEDLTAANMDTLQKYSVDYSFDVKVPVSKLEKYILTRFCKQAAIDLQRQRGREFGFSVEGEKQRCSDLTKVDGELLPKLPTHNLLCETDLAHMDKIAIRAAACSNRKFTAKCMKDDMTLYQAGVVKIDKETKRIAKLLDQDELKWFESQRAITIAKLAEKRAKAVRADDRMNDILRACKEHGGPFTSLEEIEKALKKVNEEKDQKRMLRNELLIRKQMCKRDQRENPSLYKVNCMTVAQMKINLGILLSGDHNEDIDAVIQFPDESTMLSVLDDPVVDVVNEDSMMVDESADENDIPLNEPCAVIWDDSTKREWFLGMTREKIRKDEYLIDYLEPDPKDASRKHWRYPYKPDEQPTNVIQIIPCNVIGAWDLTARKPTFVLHNHDIIQGLFQELYMKK